MIKATKADKQRIVEIIAQTYAANPSYLAVIRKNGREKQSMMQLAEFVFNTSLRKGSIYFSSDKNGIAIWYRKNAHKETLADYWDQFLLATKVIGLGNVLKTLKREAYIDAQRPQDGNYLYFWFFGVTKDGHGTGAAVELKNGIFEDAQKHNLPIYLETSIEQNRRVYQRYGFEVYHTWYNPDEDLTRYFMKRE